MTKFKVGDCTLNGALIKEIRNDDFLATWENGYSAWYPISDLESGYAKLPIKEQCNNLTSAQELESPKNLLTGIMNTSEEILENGESNLSELRQGIHFVQSEPEILQQGMQVPEREGRHQFRGSDRNVRVRNDSSESGGTLWGEAENNLEAVQGSGVQIQDSSEQEEYQDRQSKSRKQRELERGSDRHRQRLHHGEMPESSQSKGDGELRLPTHLSDGEIHREIPGVLQQGTREQRDSSSHQSQQAGQPNREPSNNETLGTHQTSQRSKEKQCLNNSICAVGWVQGFASQDCNSDLTLLEPQRLTNTAQASLNCDIPIPAYTTTEMCEKSQIVQNTNVATICTQEESISSQLLHPAPHFLQKANGLEVQTSVIVSPQFSKSSENCNLDSQLLKMSQDLSPALIIQDSPRVHISEEWSEPLTSSGTMRNGWLSEADTLPAPTLEKDYCWLRSPGALSLSGNGRPPGQTKQEAQLKKSKVLAPGEVVNPEFLESAYSLPLGWTDPQDERSALELLAEMEQSAIAAQPSEMHSTGELPPSPCNELFTSIQLSKVEPTQELESLVLCPSCGLQHIYLSGGCGICGLEPEIQQIKPKKQPKGCLYKYLERKKLKDGSVIEYPRVDGDRDPENPLHWRWGFNWELKIDDKWKGRSIGSIPVEIVLDIKLMQIDGASLEEIISFIKRVKSKK